MRVSIWPVIPALLLSAFAALATAPAPIPTRGTIARIDNKSVTITKRDGTAVVALIVPSTNFSAVEPRRFDQIKPDDFLGVTTVAGPGGKRRAEEIHLLPKGLLEGSFPWDQHPDLPVRADTYEMTNGNVAPVPEAAQMTNATVAASGAMELRMTYKGERLVDGQCVGLAAQAGDHPCTGVTIVVVPPAIPIAAVVPAQAAEASVGLTVFALLKKGPNGKPIAASLIVEKNGIKPVF